MQGNTFLRDPYQEELRLLSAAPVGMSRYLREQQRSRRDHGKQGKLVVQECYTCVRHA